MSDPIPPPGSPSSASDHETHDPSGSAHPSVSDDPGATAGAETQDHLREKKRRRPALACEQCRKRKVKCDRAKPCGPCLKARIEVCTYAPTHVPATRGKKAVSAGTSGTGPSDDSSVLNVRKYELRPAAPAELLQGFHGILPPPTESRSSNPTSVDGSTSASSKSHDVEWLVQRVHFLQEKLDSVTRARESQEEEYGVDKEKHQCAQPRWPGNATLQHQEKGSVLKTRYYSRGHWMHGAYLFPMELSLLVHAENTKDEIYWNLTRCKDYARKIKNARMQPLISTNLGRSIPARELADPLIEAYLRAFEGSIRVLHVPSFRAEYERFWICPEAASMPFRMQLQLCLAIGAALHDDKFTLRQSAMHWVYEAQLWMMLPPEKDRVTYMGLQIMCLLCVARTVCAIGADLAWLAGGGLIRMAIYMGLHRDPRQLGNMSVYRAEMRRRLWATVLELDVQFAVDSGASATLEDADYDTLPPANLNDDQLNDEPDRDRPGAPGLEVPTQSSVQIVLQRSIPLRVAILRHINGLQGEDSYNATLSLNSRLTKECRHLTKSLHDLKIASAARVSSGGDHCVSSFHASQAELALYRCFHTLHQPIIMQSLEDPRFYFSRKMFLDSSLKIARLCHLTKVGDQQDASSVELQAEADFKRFLTNSAGMIRNVVGQSLMGLGLRIIHLKEDQSLSLGYFPTGFEEGMPSRELRQFLERTFDLARRRIQSGETGIKVMCFVGAALARHEKTEAGADVAAVQDAILASATASSREAIELLRARAHLEGTILPDDDTGTGTNTSEDPGPMNLGTGNTTIFGALQALTNSNGLGDGMDWMTDWAWDDMSEFGWPAGGQQSWGQGGQLDPMGNMPM